MFGTYQHSELRIEIDAGADEIGACLSDPETLKQWLWLQQMHWPASSASSATLSEGQAFDSVLGVAKIHHYVEKVAPFGVRFLLSGSIDGFHEWQWGDGWVQSRLEGISLLPLNLGQTASLLLLKQYLQKTART
ncbi:MAG: hypothetical protein WBD47_16820 [Phormidesmis sp.]